MPASPTPVRQQLKSFPTPRIEDILFWETKECSRVEIPEYGTPHPDANKWPNHRFSLAEPLDDQGLTFKWWYCADRERQDDWNAEIKYFFGGNPDYPRFTRTYILRRGTGPGESMEKIPSGTPDSVFTTARLVAYYVLNMEGPIGSLYQTTIRTFDVIPGGPGDTTDPGGTGISQADVGITIKRPIETKDWIELTWKLTLPREVAMQNLSDDYAQCIIPGFENLVLVDEALEVSDNNDQEATLVRVYVGDQTAPNPGPSDTLKKKVRELPGSLPPDKFCTVVTVTDDTNIVLDPNNIDVTTLAAPSGTLVKAESSPGSGILKGTTDVQYGAYTKTTLSGRQWDENLQAFTTYTTQVLNPTDAAAAASGAAPGTEVTLTPLNTYWTLVTSEVPPVSAIGSTAVKFRTTHPFTWPRVLIDLQYGGVGKRPSPGEPATDGFALFLDYIFKPEWSGLCRAEVEIAFYVSNPIAVATSIPTQSLAPSSLQFSWPGVASVVIPSCLHDSFTFTGTTGTDDPQWAYVVYEKEWPASSLWTGGSAVDALDWPASLVVDYQVRPYKNGFLVKQIRVYSPY